MVPSPTGAAPNAAPPGKGSCVALATLVALVVLSPWAFGSVDPWAVRTITLVCLCVAFVAVEWDFHAGALALPAGPLWPLAGLWLLAALQLAPLPEPFHWLIAPGSAVVWHPNIRAAAEVLGPGPHPVSLYEDATKRAFGSATGLLLLALVSVPALRDRRLLLQSSVVIVTGGVAVALYALVARLAFPDRLYGVWDVPTVAPFGPFVNKNHFAGYVEIAALLAVGLAMNLTSEARRAPGFLSWTESSRARWIVVAWGAAAILILAIPLSLSRGGVLSLSGGLVALGGLRFRSRKGRSRNGVLVAIAGIFLLIATVVYVLPDEARERLSTLTGATTERSGAYRLAVWHDTLRLFRSSPWIGYGAGTFEDALLRFKTTAGGLAVEHAENDYLELLAEVGLVGCFLASAFVGLVVIHGLRVIAATGERSRWLGRGALAGLVAVAVHSAFDFNLRIPSNALIVVAVLAMVLASEPTPKMGRLPGLAVRLTLLLTLALAVRAPWSKSANTMGPLTRVDTRESSLRRADMEARLVGYLGHRPTDSAAWLALAWLRLPSANENAMALADWAVQLDPSNLAVSEARRRLRPDLREP